MAVLGALCWITIHPEQPLALPEEILTAKEALKAPSRI
jgi:hypothetical protein